MYVCVCVCVCIHACGVVCMCVLYQETLKGDMPQLLEDAVFGKVRQTTCGSPYLVSGTLTLGKFGRRVWAIGFGGNVCSEIL